LQRCVNFVFYNKQLTSGSPEGYSGRSNKRAVKSLKYNSESVKFAVDIFSMYTLLKLLLPPQNLSLYTHLKSRISQYIFLYQCILAETCVYIFATFVSLYTVQLPIFEHDPSLYSIKRYLLSIFSSNIRIFYFSS
jgi:hypothetical protein